MRACDFVDQYIVMRNNQWTHYKLQKCRPQDPVEFIAKYMMDHNPEKQ